MNNATEPTGEKARSDDSREALPENDDSASEFARLLALMRATFDATTDGILVTNKDRVITGFNQRYLAMWDIERDRVEGQPHTNVADACAGLFDDPRAFTQRIDQIHNSSNPEAYDLLELNDGRVFERYSRISTVDDHSVGRVWSFRDIIGHRRTEQALRDETSVLELLNETGKMIASQRDLQTLVQAVTDAATRLSGAAFGAFFYSIADEQGDALQLFTLSGSSREAFEKFGHPRSTALFGPTFRGETVVRCDDVLVDARYGHMAPHHGMPAGHPAVRSYLAVPVKLRSGEVIGGLIFGHPEPAIFTQRTERIINGLASQAAIAFDNARLYDDLNRAADERAELLTAERRARAEAERKSMIRDEFVATLSHELRTPLNAILGWSQVLRARTESDDELQEGLAVIERNAKVQTRLIEDLLDMSRIISGKVRLDVQRVDLQEVVKAAVASVRHSAEAKDIRLNVMLDPHAAARRSSIAGGNHGSGSR